LRIAVVFSGQGAQSPGMGRPLYDSSAAAKAWFDGAGEHIKHLCFDADEQTLNQTLNTQPAVYALGMAAYAALKERLDAAGIQPAMFAGHSLGEYGALTAAGAIPAEQGAALIQRRAELMSAAAGTGNTGAGMCAVMADADTVTELCGKAAKQGLILPVNYNAPTQTVVAGEGVALEAFLALAAENRVRAVPLKVSGAFHSPLMEKAYSGLAEYLCDVDIAVPELPVYGNADGLPYSGTPVQIKEKLAMQVKSPVLWVDTVSNMAADGADIFIEVGAGRVLSGLIRKIDRGLKVFSVSDGAGLEQVMEELTRQ